MRFREARCVLSVESSICMKLPCLDSSSASIRVITVFMSVWCIIGAGWSFTLWHHETDC